jgi:phage terminase large subunit-like protein
MSCTDVLLSPLHGISEVLSRFRTDAKPGK